MTEVLKSDEFIFSSFSFAAQIFQIHSSTLSFHLSFRSIAFDSSFSNNSSIQTISFTRSFISKMSLFYTETHLVIEPIFSSVFVEQYCSKMFNKFISSFESCYYLSLLHVKHKLIVLAVKVLLALLSIYKLWLEITALSALHLTVWLYFRTDTAGISHVSLHMWKAMHEDVSPFLSISRSTHISWMFYCISIESYLKQDLSL